MAGNVISRSDRRRSRRIQWLKSCYWVWKDLLLLKDVVSSYRGFVEVTRGDGRAIVLRYSWKGSTDMAWECMVGHGGTRRWADSIEGKDHVHFAYIKHIQEFEGYDKAIELSVFGERILNSQLSDTLQEGCNLFWVLPDCPQSKIKKTKKNLIFFLKKDKFDSLFSLFS